CQNHLKQLGLAMHNYIDSFGVFPCRRYGTTGQLGSSTVADGTNKLHNAGRINGFIALLPFYEQKAMFDRIQMGDPSASPPIGAGGPRGDQNWAVWNIPPAILICPSDAGVKLRGDNQTGKSHSYVFSAGDTTANINTI